MEAKTYSGKPCVKGHGAVRYRSNRACVFCVEEGRKRSLTKPGNLEKRREQQRKWHAAHPELARRAIWKRNGIDPDAAAAALAAHSGVCDCCGGTDTGKMDWCVDHDHTTGSIRGVVCQWCNKGIGLLGDNAEGVERALSYLKGA